MKDAGYVRQTITPSFKLCCLTRQDIVNWFHGGFVFLQESKVMVQLFIEVCWTIATNAGLVRNDDFLKRMMATDHDDMFEDLFEK